MKKIILTVVFFSIMPCFVFGQSLIKKPAVSGSFYSADPQALSVQIKQYLDAAQIEPFSQRVPVLIAPHAGYVYSGRVAAYSYKAVSRQSVKTVVLIGPSHFYRLDGVSIWLAGSFQTPLGNVEVDSDFTQKLLSRSKRFHFIPQAFDREHSLEVQLPFLQETFKNFKIVPILIGTSQYQDCVKLESALQEVIGDREDVLIVVSTDLSHYYKAQTAEKMDKETLNEIEKLDAHGFWQECLLGQAEACGMSAVVTALLYARHQGLTPRVLKYGDSGDVTGNKTSVVGYSSVVFLARSKKQIGEKKKDAGKEIGGNMLTKEEKIRLLKIARKTIETYLSTGETLPIKEEDQRLWKKEGAFVTLNEKGQLRGCIGHIIGRKPLFLTIRDVAIASATQDPRFPPVTKDEMKDINIEISVLSKPERITDINKIQMGVHGVIVSQGLFHSGVFLPQVATEFGWSREEFLNNLCAHKAGLPAGAWRDPKTTIEIFTADVFSEKEFLEE